MKRKPTKKTEFITQSSHTKKHYRKFIKKILKIFNHYDFNVSLNNNQKKKCAHKFDSINSGAEHRLQFNI